MELDGEPYPARAEATLTEDGRGGQAPCNRFTADYVGRWPDLSFRLRANSDNLPGPAGGNGVLRGGSSPDAFPLKINSQICDLFGIPIF